MNDTKTSDTDAFTLLGFGFGLIHCNRTLVLPSWNGNIDNLFLILQAPTVKRLWLFGSLVLPLQYVCPMTHFPGCKPREEHFAGSLGSHSPCDLGVQAPSTELAFQSLGDLRQGCRLWYLTVSHNSALFNSQ